MAMYQVLVVSHSHIPILTLFDISKGQVGNLTGQVPPFMMLSKLKASGIPANENDCAIGMGCSLKDSGFFCEWALPTGWAAGRR